MKDTKELITALAQANQTCDVRVRVYSEPAECNWDTCSERATRVVAIDIDGESCAAFGACEAHADEMLQQCGDRLDMVDAKLGTAIVPTKDRAN